MDQKYKLVDARGRTVSNPTNLRLAVKVLLSKPGHTLANEKGKAVLSLASTRRAS